MQNIENWQEWRQNPNTPGDKMQHALVNGSLPEMVYHAYIPKCCVTDINFKVTINK